jgi:hypothetical protein
VVDLTVVRFFVVTWTGWLHHEQEEVVAYLGEENRTRGLSCVADVTPCDGTLGSRERYALVLRANHPRGRTLFVWISQVEQMQESPIGLAPHP